VLVRGIDDVSVGLHNLEKFLFRLVGLVLVKEQCLRHALGGWNVTLVISLLLASGVKKRNHIDTCDIVVRDSLHTFKGVYKLWIRFEIIGSLRGVAFPCGSSAHLLGNLIALLYPFQKCAVQHVDMLGAKVLESPSEAISRVYRA